MLKKHFVQIGTTLFFLGLYFFIRSFLKGGFENPYFVIGLFWIIVGLILNTLYLKENGLDMRTRKGLVRTTLISSIVLIFLFIVF
jgi:hypothetical protein